jgi:predicted PilT family ATPase
MYHNLKLVNDAQLSREISRVKGVRVAYESYLERLLREERQRLFSDGTVDAHLAEALDDAASL